MARADRILTPDQVLVNESLGATTAGAAVSVGGNKSFSVSASGGVHMLWGTSSVAAPAATTGMVLPAGHHTFNSMDRFTHVRIFNPGASAVVYSICNYFNC